MKREKHILTVILVSVAVLGAVVAMCVIQPESDAKRWNEVVDTEKQYESPANFRTADIRKGVLVDSFHTES